MATKKSFAGKGEMAEAVLFDLDGVVVRTDRLHFASWKEICDSQGWLFDEETNNLLRGVPRLESLRIILRKNGVSLSEAEEARVAEEKNAVFRSLLASLSENDLMPGAVEIVEGARSLGAKTAICSSSRNASDIVKTLKLGRLFDAITTANEVARAKPAPDIFLASAKTLRVEPSLCVVVEDAQAGIDAARAAKMRSVGIGPAKLKGATLLISSFVGMKPETLLLPEGGAKRR